MIRDRLNKKKFIEIMDGEAYPLFYIDTEKDEFDAHDSFFVYDDDGRIEKAQASMQFLQEFILGFITKDDTKINVLELAERLQKCGLTLSMSDSEVGEVADTGKKAKMTTMTFKHALVVDY